MKKADLDRQELHLKLRYMLAAAILLLNPTMALAEDWGGLYLGAQVGWAEATGSDPKLDGLAYGVTAGYNWLAPKNFLIGVEASWMDGQVDFASPAVIASVGNLITLGPRLGYVKEKLLIYGEGGFASARVTSEHPATSVTTATSFSSNARGIFLGAGVDYAFSDKLSFGAEYNRIEFDSFEHGGAVVEDASMETIVARITYRFGK